MGGQDGLDPHNDTNTPARCPVPAMDLGRPDCSRPNCTLAGSDDKYASFNSTTMTAGLLETATPPPATHGSPDANLYHEKSPGFVPPVRPSSTPYPSAETRNTIQSCIPHAPGSPLSQQAASPQLSATSPSQLASYTTPRPAIHFALLPTEVHETILDHLFGYTVSPASIITALAGSSCRSLGTALRHSRRREMTDLALVSRLWRILVQQRLYRHIKLKGTINSIDQAIVHFADRERLASYVKHIEIWFPVFQHRYGTVAISNTHTLPTVTTEGLTTTTYVLPNDNCTLEDVFRFVSVVLPEAKIFTLEGGERRKAPKVAHFHERPADSSVDQRLSQIPAVQTLVTKGQWNLMRENRDFDNILDALPNLVEWQGAYSKPKSKSYITISQFIPFLPPRIRNLTICLENDYRREPVVPAFYLKAALQTHLCAVMGRMAPTLEQFAYTGRVCHHFFETAASSSSHVSSRLRSIDVTIKNCCRAPGALHETASGIQEMAFIEAFERMVISAIRSLRRFEHIEYLRIRFVDLGMCLSITTVFKEIY